MCAKVYTAFVGGDHPLGILGGFSRDLFGKCIAIHGFLYYRCGCSGLFTSEKGLQKSTFALDPQAVNRWSRFPQNIALPPSAIELRLPEGVRCWPPQLSRVCSSLIRTKPLVTSLKKS